MAVQLRPRVMQENGSNSQQATGLALAAAAGAWVVLALTARGMPIAGDEGSYLLRADRIIAWFRLLADPSAALGGLRAFSSAAIQEHWQFITWWEGHPAWFAVPIALGMSVLEGAVDPLMAARVGPMSVFAVACGGVAFRLKNEYGCTAAVIAPLALLTFPRIFSEAHFATLDGQLTAWWLLLWAVDTSRQRPARSVAVGVLLGLTCATKFTGWLAWGGVVLPRIISRDRRLHRELLIIAFLGVLTFFAVNPPLWHAPIESFRMHLYLSLRRADAWNIPVFFLGRVYDMHHSLPWYNTIVWLLLVTPFPTLLLGAVGMHAAVDKRVCNGPGAGNYALPASIAMRLPDRASLGLVLHWAAPMIVRALPGAPPHDGVRLFLPAFGFWCVLAAIGAQRFWHGSTRLAPARTGVRRALLVALLAGTGLNLARYYPQTLSHYSLLAGGVRGAAALGMEPAYWWDALDAEALAWLNAHAAPDEAVAFSRIPAPNVALLRKWGRLRPIVADARRGEPFKWYVLQNRPGALSDVERALMTMQTAAYAKHAGRWAAAVPFDLKVPLLLIFSSDQYERAAVAARGN